MVIRPPSSSTYTRRNKSNGDAKFAVTPHRRSTVLVKHLTQRFHWELGRTREPICKKFSFDIQSSSVLKRSQILHIEQGRNPMLIHTAVEHNKKFYRRHLRRADNRCFLSWPSPFGSFGRIRENKTQKSVGVNGDGKQIRRWRRRLQQQKSMFTKSRQSKHAKAQVSQQG
jgi:hypothetical protein